jgi:hypothetical protein
MAIFTALPRTSLSRSIPKAANVWAAQFDFASCTAKRYCFSQESASDKTKD